MSEASFRPVATGLAGVLLAAALVVGGTATAQAAPVAKATQPQAVTPVAIDANSRPVAVDAPAVDASLSQESAPASAVSSSRDWIVSNKGASPDSIIGGDSRTRVTSTSRYPNSAIVHITRGGAAHCTGWMVSRDTLVTAGHCLYNRGSGSWYSGLSFSPGRNAATTPFGSATAVRSVTDANYITSGDTRQDWGIVKLNRPIGDSTGWFGLRWQTASYNGSVNAVRGYPGDKAFGTMWTMSGPIKQSTGNGLCYEMDTIGGQSGSPVFGTSTNQAIAIHTMGTGGHGLNGCATNYNAATRITQGLYNLILSEAR